MNVKEIRAIRHAIAAHYNGWQLLRNPEGVPVTTVRMLKKSDRIEEATLDTFEYYSRSTTDYSKPSTSEVLENLNVRHSNFYDKENKKINSKKSSTYMMFRYPQDTVKSVEKRITDGDDVEVRNLSSLHEAKFPETVLVDNLNLGMDVPVSNVLIPLTFRKSFAQLEVEKYHDEKVIKQHNSASNYSFWRTLLHNIRQK